MAETPHMTPPPLKRPPVIVWRLCVVVGVIVLLGLAAYWLATRGLGGTPTRCLMHHTTGLHCPGCGMTRATHALLHGDVVAALGHNVLGVVVLPVALIGVLLEALGWIRKTTPRYRIPLGKRGAKIIAIIFIAFTLLRNLPWFPLSWLAP